MDIRPATGCNEGEGTAPGPMGDERWGLVQRILASPVFARAPRMRALLSYLMIRKLGGMEAAISERAIAVDVFHRDPCAFDPASDPVAHVQAGRLRERLAHYFALYEPAARWHVTIPGGNLVPVLVREAGALPARRVTIELAASAPRAVRRSATGRQRARAAWHGSGPRCGPAAGRSR